MGLWDVRWGLVTHASNPAQGNSNLGAFPDPSLCNGCDLQDQLWLPYKLEWLPPGYSPFFNEQYTSHVLTSKLSYIHLQTVFVLDYPAHIKFEKGTATSGSSWRNTIHPWLSCNPRQPTLTTRWRCGGPSRPICKRHLPFMQSCEYYSWISSDSAIS